VIPSFRILEISVILNTPSLAAAPSRPPTTQLVSRSVEMMCARSALASVLPPGIDDRLSTSSATGAPSSGSARHDDGALDEVLHLADIAGPVMSDERRHDPVRDACN